MAEDVGHPRAERIAILPAQPGEQAAFIVDEPLEGHEDYYTVVPIVAWRIMYTPETTQGPALYYASPIAAEVQLDSLGISYAMKMPDGQWYDSVEEMQFNTPEEFLAEARKGRPPRR